MADMTVLLEYIDISAGITAKSGEALCTASIYNHQSCMHPYIRPVSNMPALYFENNRYKFL